MASKTVFANKSSPRSRSRKSSVSITSKAVNTVNEAGGIAYKRENRQALAQLICTGCFNSTYYVDGADQVTKIIDLCKHIEDDFIARCAVYARSMGYMKDAPALLVAILSARNYPQFEQVFEAVIDNGKMLRNFVQIVRSGTVGRKSFGTRIKRAIRTWLDTNSDDELFKDSIGNDPSLADIIKMVHPKPTTSTRSALYSYLIGKDGVNTKNLPALVKSFENFKNADARERASMEVPDVPFQMLANLNLSKEQWADVAKRGGWHMIRMNLNTFQRHGAFDVPDLAKAIAKKLVDEKAIARARVFPYQLMSAYNNVESTIPTVIKNALQDAVEVATANIPDIDGKVYVCIDVSGSMDSPVTGHRKGATTTMSCIDVAALTAASIARKNADTVVIPFSDNAMKASFNSRDSIMTNANYLRKFPRGGTNCSAPLAMLNSTNAKGDVVIYISDNESWMDTNYRWGSGTGMSQEWDKFKKRNPTAKLICIDLSPNTSTQVQERKDIMNIGGFSDNVFEVISNFVKYGNDSDRWVSVIEKTEIGV